MDRETQVEAVNICIVNALRIDEEHRVIILEKLIQNLSDENRSKLLQKLICSGKEDQLFCDYCGDTNDDMPCFCKGYIEDKVK